MSRIEVILRRLSKVRWEVEIKMYNSKGVVFFELDQYFPSQMDAIRFINDINNARQEMIVFL